MPTSVVYGDLHVSGLLTSGTQAIAAGSVVDASVNASAAIASTKMDHQYLAALGSATPAAITSIIHIAHGAGNVAFVEYAIVTAPTTSTYTFDVKKNGSSILSAPVSITGATGLTDNTVTFTPSSYVAGDLYTVVLASFSGGSYGTGLRVQVAFREAAGV